MNSQNHYTKLFLSVDKTIYWQSAYIINEFKYLIFYSSSIKEKKKAMQKDSTCGSQTRPNKIFFFFNNCLQLCGDYIIVILFFIEVDAWNYFYLERLAGGFFFFLLIYEFLTLLMITNYRVIRPKILIYHFCESKIFRPQTFPKLSEDLCRCMVLFWWRSFPDVGDVHNIYIYKYNIHRASKSFGAIS